ncbi:hypothetical protein L195_g028823 [Trifolium pratense]|uniref:Uncharacterized protein n=1 Tax=Trifolium pratense TaxID=57577 RepID=A0A2K3L313_TRIPR|nr:hypothetical protein L195_g028823 [Trifolium pratense]
MLGSILDGSPGPRRKGMLRLRLGTKPFFLNLPLEIFLRHFNHSSQRWFLNAHFGKTSFYGFLPKVAYVSKRSANSILGCFEDSRVSTTNFNIYTCLFRPSH